MLELVYQGDYDAAEELTIETYLENFEYLEPVLEMIDAEFMYAIEIEMREELRIILRRDLPPDKIRDFVDNTILADLKRR